ncbi:MAG: biotin--[acetyl-CoA-carboxylase] ligase, partial [Akkermansiaceae bacterium]|nr:biotin--[acetyl-CoA-carboxylase] ligase [Akkermansiaceae bacterium]
MDSPEALSPARIRAALTEKLGPALAARFEPWVVAETGSTNSDLLAQGRDHAVAEGRVLFAESQTAGRGRRGDPWVAPPGTNLLLSILLRPGGP